MESDAFLQRLTHDEGIKFPLLTSFAIDSSVPGLEEGLYIGYLIESLKDLNFRGCIKHEVQLCSLINPSQIVFPYLSHRFCTEPLKMAIFGFSKQIFSAKNQLYLFKNDFLLRIFD